MIDKRVKSLAQAMDGIKDGSVVLLGGFGVVGQPQELLGGLIEQGARDLTIVSNNAGSGSPMLPKLFATGRVKKLICSFPRPTPPEFEALYKSGKIELEIVPQGTIAERIRAAAVGVPAFYTPTAAGTKLAHGKESREFDGRTYLMERALHADVALIQAWRADRWGNLTYRGTGRNFNPVMAMAAKLTIVQTRHIVELGELDPETIVTPGIFVDRVIEIDSPDPPPA
ncbi:MAG TPA: 3-oxoacid CoA-transferase subunit A [Micropepsaceae bacterium]|nr:3-oxoacid CoA-transferase subunit A [Micropepsaceae bacterium]